MGKQMKIASAICLATVLLLFLAQSFREAMNTSLIPWKVIFSTQDSGDWYGYRWPDSELKHFAARAMERRDAKALAFVATRLSDPSASAEAASNAVSIDPELTWVYYVVAVRHPSLPHTRQWATALRDWDPQNGASFLLIAEAVDLEQVDRGLIKPGVDRTTAEWRAAIAAAVQAPRFDDYLERQWEVDRDVVRRYSFDNPALFLTGFRALRLPSYAASDVSRYLDPSRPMAFLSSVSTALYNQPGARSTIPETEANASALLIYLRELLTRTSLPQQEVVTPRSVRAFQLSGLTLLLFLVLLGAGVISRRKWPGIGFIGASGLLLSSITLYIAFLSSSRVFTRFIDLGDPTHVADLRAFYGLVGLPFGLERSGPTMRFGVWAAVILLGLASLLYIGFRQLLTRRAMNPHNG